MSRLQKKGLMAGFSLVLMAGAMDALAGPVEESQALYREHCRQCHMDGSENGEYSPVSYIQSQWERFFDRKYVRHHKDVIDEKFGGRPVTEVITPEILEKLRVYTINHAADSEQPMTCD